MFISAEAIEAMIDAEFRASLRPEEGLQVYRALGGGWRR
jgi:hypothetical protein